MFLEQYWGGPTTYSEQRGHPRLRMRHVPFRVTPAQRDRWLTAHDGGGGHPGAAARQRPAPAGLPRAGRPLDGQRLRVAVESSCSSRKTLQKSTSFSRGHGGACVPVTDVLDSAVRTATLIHPADSPDAAWWRDAVIYQVYPRSFADGNGDGIGDLPGITARLPYLATSASTPSGSRRSTASPQADAGYDVADYRDVDPLFGTLADADALIARGPRARPARSSSTWCPTTPPTSTRGSRRALAAGPGTPERERYIFRDGTGDRRRTSRPTTGSRSSAARPGPARPGRHPGQWYLHLFDPKQPDFNWEHPEVRAEFDVDPAVLARPRRRRLPGRRRARPGQGGGPARLERGRTTCSTRAATARTPPSRPMWDQDGVHEIYRQWRAILDALRPARPHPVRRGLGRSRPSARHATSAPTRCTRPSTSTTCRPPGTRGRPRAGSSTTSLDGDATRSAPRPPGCCPTTTSSGTPPGSACRSGSRGPTASAPRTRSPTASSACAGPARRPLLMLALPGSRLPLPGRGARPARRHRPAATRYRQDPAFRRTDGERDRPRRLPGADPVERRPPRSASARPTRSWLPQPTVYGELAVDRQDGVEGSTLELYRSPAAPAAGALARHGRARPGRGLRRRRRGPGEPRPGGSALDHRRGQPRVRARRPARRPDRADRLGSPDRRGPRARGHHGVGHALSAPGGSHGTLVL